MDANEARRIANSYTRKKHRKGLLKQYKFIGGHIKNAAKKG